MEKSQRRFLDRIERLGNRIPHPTLLFVYLCLIVMLLSWVLSAAGVYAIHPVSGEKIQVINLLSRWGLHKILTSTVNNFTQFAPVGTVLVAMLGIGVAEKSGLLACVMRSIVAIAPPRSLTFFVVLAGVLSSLAADSGYVVLVPLAAILFAASGRHPLAGIAAAFAGVSAGYSANLALGPLDAMLAGISTEAAQLVDPAAEVSPAGNYYFMVASTFFIALLISWLTEKITIPRLPFTASEAKESVEIPHHDSRGLRAVGLLSLALFCLLLIALVPERGWLRGEEGGVLEGPFIKGIVTLIALYFGLAGTVFGYASGRFSSTRDVIESMEEAMATMSTYLVLMFFAAQFVSYFAWTNLGVITAISGAELLQTTQLSSAAVLVIFVVLAALINLLIGSASAKWSVMAPVFVPMLMLYGIAPEATQAAYRIGDSSSNIVTPLMPYFGIVVAFAKRYDKNAGVGTLLALMLPYSLALLVGWSALLALWVSFGWPLGPA